jgi:putative phosphoserine phosphatase/1-acylglycerol-3-phosphate O-acyltransferase
VKLYSKITKEVDRAPSGPRTVAFFDLDGTLIAGFSITSLLRERLSSFHLGLLDAAEELFDLANHAIVGRNFPALLEHAVATLKGIAEQDFIELGDAVFEKYTAGDIYPESRALVQAHQDRGHTVVILSSATIYQVKPIADELGIENIICNRLVVRDGVFTGEVDKPLCYAEGKLFAAQDYVEQHSWSLEDCYFYSDGFEDLPLLDGVGFPRPLNPDYRLGEAARERGWPVRKFSSRGMPGFKEVLRTGLAYGAFMSAAISIVPTWILNQSRREAVNLAVTTWGEFGSALAGIKINVRGEENLWAKRPAVFLFNHQSAADVLIMSKLLRRDFTAIAKKEIAGNPLVGPVFRVADAVFVDRRNHEKAMEALKPVVDMIHEGLSLAIAPEGTRSAGRRLGPFKKGPFHIAMQAGVPVVPIVIHNATDVLPKGAFFLRPAEVYVDVLEPISTAGWVPERAADYASQIRQKYLETLGQAAERQKALRSVS